MLSTVQYVSHVVVFRETVYSLGGTVLVGNGLTAGDARPHTANFHSSLTFTFNIYTLILALLICVPGGCLISSASLTTYLDRCF